MASPPQGFRVIATIALASAGTRPTRSIPIFRLESRCISALNPPVASGVRRRRLADTAPLCGHHEADDIGHPVAGLPVQQHLGLAGITAVVGDLRGAEEGRVLFD